MLVADAKKPPAKVMESRDPHSIRFAPGEWAAFMDAAAHRKTDPSRLVRDCSLIGLRLLPAMPDLLTLIAVAVRVRPALDGVEAHTRETA
jgi:hypothetical protein